MCSKSALSAISRQIAKAYDAVYGDSLVKVWLYGSYARGDSTQDSDIDIVAIVRGERSSLQEQLKKIWDVSAELELEYETIVSPTVIPADEFEKYKDDIPYYRNIQKEGVMIDV
ncbi:MAG: nucleotidyltransferase domain-containing protein [Lachnospiraceae bacterium]|nr:nucleotidyltransferase domain-containing protein [Lachnospiraceae bacterium]